MTDHQTESDNLDLRIAVAKDRLSRLLETTTSEGSPGQLSELIQEEESEITRLANLRKEPEVSHSSLMTGPELTTGSSKGCEEPASADIV